MDLSETIKEITPEKIQFIWKLLLRTAKVAPSHKTGGAPFPRVWMQYYQGRCFITVRIDKEFYNYVVVPGTEEQLAPQVEKYLKE